MPVGEHGIKECNCCGKKSVSVELVFICDKCINDGHTGFIGCKRCEDIKKYEIEKVDI